MLKRLLQFLRLGKTEGLVKETVFPNGTVAQTVLNTSDKTKFSKVVIPAKGSFLDSLGVEEFKVNYAPTVSNMASHGGKAYNVISTVSVFTKDGVKTLTPQMAKGKFKIARTAQNNGLKVGL